jgi:hypothetical protein
VDIAKELQRLRSWEGRLKAMEQRMKGQGAAPKAEEAEEADDEPAEQAAQELEQAAEATDDPDMAQATRNAAEAIESGDMSVDEAMSQLEDDFGPAFVQLIKTISAAEARNAAASIADQRVGQLDTKVNQAVSSIADERARAHFEQIAEHHPDFAEVGQSEDFGKWVASLPDDQRQRVEATVARGKARDVVKVLSDYKASKTTDPEVDDAMDAAQGVRSRVKLPSQPKPAPDSYEAAWDHFG